MPGVELSVIIQPSKSGSHPRFVAVLPHSLAGPQPSRAESSTTVNSPHRKAQSNVQAPSNEQVRSLSTSAFLSPSTSPSLALPPHHATVLTPKALKYHSIEKSSSFSERASEAQRQPIPSAPSASKTRLRPDRLTFCLAQTPSLVFRAPAN